MKVMIACGGTGGHLFPGLAVAEALRERQHQVWLLVSEKAIDRTALAPLTNCSDPSARIAVRVLPAVGYEGSSRLIRFCSRLARATHGCAVACDKFEPDVVLGMGGFTSVPALVAARWFRRRGTVTGTPIRAALRERSRKDGKGAARERLGLRPERLTVLVAGGSQGAHAINEAIGRALPWLTGRQGTWQFVHLTGPQDEPFVDESYERNGFEAKVMSFCDQMELAYGAADLVVARSGAATLAEIAAFGLPSILMPYPHAAGNHQWHNARVFERAGAAHLVEQAQLNANGKEPGQRLAAVIAGLLDNEAGRREMGRAARTLAVDDAAERLANLLEHSGH
jgi:UDP-N-acetylglucosamine--N-acetylmuramyl-(pentapeptide) pyrophosphoryl-undecaprenol N-acetylglucosamine transferase